MDDKDDEISIDFSKIKNFFKKKSEKRESNIRDNPNHDDKSREGQVDALSDKQGRIDAKNENTEEDDISFDFSKVKAFFKSEEDKSSDSKAENKGKPGVMDNVHTNPSKDDEEISFDLKKIKA